LCIGYTERRKTKREGRGRATVAVSAEVRGGLDQKKTTAKKCGPLPVLCALNINTVHKRGKVPNYKMNIMYGKCRR
jgi:hypothetical protein